MLTIKPEMLQPDAFCKMRTAVGAPSRTPLEKLTALLRPIAVFEESTSKKRKRGERRRGRVGETRWRDLAHPKILAWHPMAKPLAGFNGAASRLEGEQKGKGGKRNGNREKDRKEKMGRGGKLEQGRQLAKAGLVYTNDLPDDLKHNILSLSTFRRQLKRFLLLVISAPSVFAGYFTATRYSYLLTTYVFTYSDARIMKTYETCRRQGAVPWLS